MASTPSIRIIPESDFKDSGEFEYFKKLLKPLNQFIQAVNLNLDKGLTTSQNIVSQINDLTFYVSSDHTPWPLGFIWQNAQVPPVGCIVIDLDSTDGQERMTSAASVKWSYDDGRIVIDSIRAAFTSGYQYKVRLFTFA